MPFLYFPKNKSWPILFYVCHMGARLAVAQPQGEDDGDS
jgi:hypothetical protein